MAEIPMDSVTKSLYMSFPLEGGGACVRMMRAYEISDI